MDSLEIWDFINPALKVLLYLATFGTVGTILFATHFGKYQSFASAHFCGKLTKKIAVIGAVISVASFFSIAGNLGGSLGSVIDAVMLQLALDSKSGVASLIAFTGFSLTVITAKTMAQPSNPIPLLGSALILLSLVVVGHASRIGLGTQVLLLIHLVGIAYWLGSLIPFHRMSHSSEEENLPFIAHRFGVLGMGYIGALVIGGVGFAYNLLGGLSELFSTNYGNVLLAKVMLVTVILSLGAYNKFRVVPLFSDNYAIAAQKLRFSIRYECALALCILALSSFLTTSVSLPRDI